MNIQEKLDAKKYPPTMQFNAKFFTPIGPLVDRLAIMTAYYMEFWETGEYSFLDVGCSKGFFSFFGSKLFSSVVAIDKDEEVIDLCGELQKLYQSSTVFMCTSFKDFEFDMKFNRVFVGNGPHIQFIDYRGWDWIGKVAELTELGGLFLTEGPVGLECTDTKSIPDEIKVMFNRGEFEAALKPYFEQIGPYRPTCDYTPDRYFSLWKRL